MQHACSARRKSRRSDGARGSQTGHGDSSMTQENKSEKPERMCVCGHVESLHPGDGCRWCMKTPVWDNGVGDWVQGCTGFTDASN